MRSPRWIRRAVQALVVLTALAVCATGGLLWYVQWRVDQIPRVRGLKTVLADTGADDQPMNILLVGSDSRSDIPVEEEVKFGNTEQVKGSRSDTMMIVHADPRTRQLSVLSIPRDLWVTLADVGVEDRINQAFDGGPSRLVRTMQREIGIQINHYAEVDFVGFRGVVKAIGGVSVYAPRPARDAITGLSIPTAGCTLLDAEMALAYVRSRSYQELVNGRWRTDPTADLGRIKRQQGFIRHTLRRGIERGARNPVVLDKLISAAVKTISLDDAFSTSDIIGLARKFRTIEPESIRTFVLPTTAATIDRKAVLLLDRNRANDVINRFNGFGPPQAMSPSRVELRIARGDGDADVRSLTKRFDALGFVMQDPLVRRSPFLEELAERDAEVAGPTTTAAPARRSRRTTTTAALTPRPIPDPSATTIIRHRPESGDKAMYVAGFFIGGGRLVEDAGLAGADVEVIPGRNYVGTRDHNIGFIGPLFEDNDDAAAHKCA